VAVLSEQMTQAEEEAFEKQWGYKPTHLHVALDPVVVVVHPSNPVAEHGLTLAELDAIFSHTRNRNHANIQGWGGLGLHGQWGVSVSKVGEKYAKIVAERSLC
jgi:phosphate transport system substrate-binding protein